MIDLTVLDGLKLVREEYIANDLETAQFIEKAIQQGSQGWGVRREEGVVLRLAKELRVAQELAGSADEAQRKLKGTQLELGRVKKALSVAEGLVESKNRKIAELVKVSSE
jgi:hypothetical protein